jgi:hypothetical protein
VLAAAGIALLFLYFYRIAFWPAYDFDELGFLNIPYRFVNFGDFRYPVFLDTEGFHSDPLRKYPPLVAALLRSLTHAIFGFSAAGSRILSGTLMFGASLLAVMLLLRMRVAAGFAAVALLVIGLQPSVLIGARTVRLEQEIVFLSVLAVSLPLLVGGRFPRAAWTISGLAAGWAGMSHPWGLSIGAGLFLAVVAYPAAWRQHDGLSWPARLAFLAAGAMPPALATAYSVFHDWPVFREYVQAQADLYAIRNAQNVEFFAAAYRDSWASKVLPAWWAAKIHELDLYAVIAPYGYRRTGVFTGLLWAQLALIVAFLAIALRRKVEAADLPPLAFAFATVGVMGMFLLYPPSTNYYAYPSLMIPIAAALILAWFWFRRVRVLGAAASLVAIVATADVSIHMLRAAGSPVAAAPLDRYFEAQDAMGRRLGFKTTPHAFCDMATWMACGREMRSALQAVVLAPAPVPGEVDAASFHQPLLGALVDSFPSLTRPSLTADEKAARLRQLRSGLRLAGLIRVPQGIDLYFVRRPPEAGMLTVVEIDSAGHASAWTAAAFPELGCAWQRLETGRYLAVGEAAPVEPPPIRIDGQAGPPWAAGARLERIAFIELGSIQSIDVCGGGKVRLYQLRPAS